MKKIITILSFLITINIFSDSSYDYLIRIIELRNKPIIEELEVLSTLEIPKIDLESIVKNPDIITIIAKKEELLSFLSKNNDNIFIKNIKSETDELKIYLEQKIKTEFNKETNEIISILYELSNENINYPYIRNLIYSIKQNNNFDGDKLEKITKNIENILKTEEKSNEIKNIIDLIENITINLNNPFDFSLFTQKILIQIQNKLTELQKPENLTEEQSKIYENLLNLINNYSSESYLNDIELLITTKNKIIEQLNKTNDEKFKIYLTELQNISVFDKFLKNIHQLKTAIIKFNNKNIQIKSKKNEFDVFIKKLPLISHKLFKISNEIKPILTSLQIANKINNINLLNTTEKNNLTKNVLEYMEQNKLQSFGKTPESVLQNEELRLKESSSSKSGSKDLTELVMSTFTDFIVKKSKDELYLSFFRKLKNEQSLKYLFPLTYDHLEVNKTTQIYSISTTFLASLEYDLKNLLNNLIKTEKTGEINQFIELTITIVSWLKKGYHPNDIIDVVYNDYKSKENINPEIKNLLYILNVFSKELINTEEQKWINVNNFNALKENELNILVFFILAKNETELKAKSENFYKDELLTGKIKKLLKVIIPLFDLIEKQRDYLKQLGSEKITINKYYSYVTEIFNLFKTVSKILFENNLISNFFENYTEIVIKIIQSSDERSYGRGILNILTLLQKLSDESQNIEYKKEIKNLKSDILKYGSVFADILISKNESQLETVLERYVKPTSDSVNFTIYVSGNIGYQYITEKNKGLLYRFSAPAGFEYTSPAGNYGSFAFFTYFIDLATFMLYEQVFAPGFSFSYNFKNIPFSIGIGYQYFPKLEEDKKIHTGFLSFSYRMTFFEFF